MRATVANLVAGDTTRFHLGTAGIDIVEAGVTEFGTVGTAIHIQDSASGAWHGQGKEAFLLSLGPHHSFPLEEVKDYLHPNTARDVLVFIKDWWLNHIQGEDKTYAPYMEALAAK